MGNASRVAEILHYDLKTHFNFGFDLHGVIDTAPEDYKHIFRALRSNGHKIFIISGPHKEQLNKELKKLGFETGVHIDGIYSVVDFLKEQKVNMWQKDGSWWASDIDWWSSKAQICRHYGIDYMFDDTWTYKQFFRGTRTKFIHLK